jgi:GMP synthase-like glutamine amidotransferase
MRALHVVNQEGGPAMLFLPPLERRGFDVHEVNPNQSPLPSTLDGYDALLVCGGTANTHETDRYPWLEHEQVLLAQALERGVPTVGLCLGAQLLVKAAGGSVYLTDPAEIGWWPVNVAAEAGDDPVLSAMPGRFMALQWHYYGCELPVGAVELARSEVCTQAFRLGDAAWGTQFHIEVTRDVLLDWEGEGRDELARHGYDHDRYVRELDLYLPAHEAIGREMGSRFAAFAEARAQTAGVRPSSAA